MDDGVCCCCCRSVEMNIAEFLASFESSRTLGLDDHNYDSVWDHQVAEEDELEGVVKDEFDDPMETGPNQA